jgi:hypothetical protein
VIKLPVAAHGRCFSPGTPASFTTKSGRHDIAEILLKHNQSNQSFDDIKVVIRIRTSESGLQYNDQKK